LIEQLPCASCTGLCCGPVPLTAARANRIADFAKALPCAERDRLAAQKRGELDCGFLDKESHRCAIYPVRPWVCEAFGRVEGLTCPKVGHLVQILPLVLHEIRLEKDLKAGTVATSAGFDWKTLKFR